MVWWESLGFETGCLWVPLDVVGFKWIIELNAVVSLCDDWALGMDRVDCGGVEESEPETGVKMRKL